MLHRNILIECIIHSLSNDTFIFIILDRGQLGTRKNREGKILIGASLNVTRKFSIRSQQSHSDGFFLRNPVLKENYDI